ISIGTTLSLYRRSWRNLPSATSAFKSRWVALSTLTSTGIGLLLPTRSISRSCSTRSSAIWISGGKSPTSSRKIVPPFADSKRPSRRFVAPVNDGWAVLRSEEHTSELQSRSDLVCRLLLEKKKIYL